MNVWYKPRLQSVDNICPAPLHEAEKGTDYARHGVKLYSQCGCDPREQSAGGKDQR